MKRLQTRLPMRTAHHDGQLARNDRLAPTWVLGSGYLPLAINFTVATIGVPDLLAAAHVPEAKIAVATSLALATGFTSISLAPLLDWRFPRRSYAITFAVLSAACTFGALLSIGNIVLLSAFLFLGGTSAVLCVNAVGGWFGNMLPEDRKVSLGAWLNVTNFGAAGVAAPLVVYAMRHLPSPFGAASISALILLVVPLFILTPCPPADRKLASESFRSFLRDVAALFRRKDVRWALVIFLAPSASFALTNTLAGFGRDFHTSDEMVGLIGGAGGAVAGIFGSLIVPPIAKRLSPVAIYLLVGLVGAAFTLTLIPAPRDWFMFGIAMLGQNVFQAAAFTAANVITLRAIGHNNPLAATQFGVLIGATQIPLTYMQMIDGQAYGLGGLTETFLADAVISGAACVVLGLLWRFAWFAGTGWRAVKLPRNP